MSLTRRRFITTTAAGAAALALPTSRAFAQKAEFNYKYANNQPATHPMNIRATEMAEAIRVETRGRVNIELFPNNQLGTDTDVLSQLRSGGVEFFSLAGLILATLVPAASLNCVGFAFNDYDTVWKAMDGELGAYIRAQIAKANLVAMDKVWDNGFRQITNSTRPINTVDDLKGMKLRVPVAPLLTSMFKSLDASPAAINFGELYSALQTRVIEGQENPLAVISAGKFNEVQKFCSLTNHMWDGFWFLANKRAWEKLPEDLRVIVAKHINAAGVRERADLATLTNSLQAELQGKGMIFNVARTDGFREKMSKAGFYAEWKGKFGDDAWAILERTTSKLA